MSEADANMPVRINRVQDRLNTYVVKSCLIHYREVANVPVMESRKLRSVDTSSVVICDVELTAIDEASRAPGPKRLERRRHTDMTTIVNTHVTNKRCFDTKSRTRFCFLLLSLPIRI